MNGLLEQLKATDDEARQLVQVIAYFDQLMSRGANLDEIVRSAALLIDGEVGVSGQAITPRAWTRTGAPVPSRTLITHRSHARLHMPIHGSSGVVGSVWSWSAAAGVPLQKIVLERLALCAAIVARSLESHNAEWDFGSAIDRLLASDLSPRDLDQIANHLRLSPPETNSVRVLIASAPPDRFLARVAAHADAYLACQRGGQLFVAVAESVGLDRLVEAVAAVSQAVGVSYPRAYEDLATSFREATLCSHLSTPDEPVVRAESLGILSLLANVDIDSLRSHPEVRAALDVLTDNRQRNVLEVLKAYRPQSSLRELARSTHRHHSTVADQLGKVTSLLDVTEDNQFFGSRLQVLGLVLRLLEDRPTDSG